MELRRASMTSPSISTFSSFPIPHLSGRSTVTATGAAATALERRYDELRADRGDVSRLGAFLALSLFELDARTLGQGLEALTGDVAVMDEEILGALVRGDEAIPLAVVEPLDGSASHKNT